MFPLFRASGCGGFLFKLRGSLNSVRFKSRQKENTSVYRYQYNPNKVYMRETTDMRDQPAITLTFKFANDIPPMDKTYNFWCDPELVLDETIDRMKQKIGTEMRIRYDLSITDRFDENTKEWPDDAIKNFDVAIVDEHGESVTDKNWADLIADGDDLSKLKLKISDQEYDMVLNGPYISFIELPTTIMVDDDCYPSKILLENTTKEECTYKWYKGIPPVVDDQVVIYEPIDNLIKWKECSNSFFYSVTKEDIGHKLKFECTPIHNGVVGPVLSSVTKSVVVEKFGNKFDAFKERQLLTSTRLPADGNQFRVVSYNLLANFYNDARHSLADFYPYCRSEALDIDYRKKLFIRELRGYNSDVVCLQEVDSKVFHNDLKPMMDEDGLQGWHKRKGFMPEGVATFFDTKKFSMIWRGGFTIGEHVNSEPFLEELYDKIKDNSPLCNRFLLLPTAFQLTLLKSNTQNRYLLVANTHLSAQLDAAHIRLLQLQCILLYIKRVRDKELKELNIPDDQVSIVFSGDFNSKPMEGVFKLMTEKSIPPDYQDFRSNEDQAVTNISLSHDYNIASAYAVPPVYTNYTADFKGCLDYIFYETDRLKTVQAVPIPSEEVLSMETALPSIYFPSDHIALIADFEWKNK